LPSCDYDLPENSTDQRFRFLLNYFGHLLALETQAEKTIIWDRHKI